MIIDVDSAVLFQEIGNWASPCSKRMLAQIPYSILVEPGSVHRIEYAHSVGLGMENRIVYHDLVHSRMKEDWSCGRAVGL